MKKQGLGLLLALLLCLVLLPMTVSAAEGGAELQRAGLTTLDTVRLSFKLPEYGTKTEALLGSVQPADIEKYRIAETIFDTGRKTNHPEYFFGGLSSVTFKVELYASYRFPGMVDSVGFFSTQAPTDPAGQEPSLFRSDPFLEQLRRELTVDMGKGPLPKENCLADGEAPQDGKYRLDMESRRVDGKTVWYLILTEYFDVPMPEGLLVNEETFPDPYFREQIFTYHAYAAQEIRTVGFDELLTAEEISVITRLDQLKGEIQNLKGIEYLTCLESITGELRAPVIDLSQNTRLESVNFWGDHLHELILPKTSTLKTVVACNAPHLGALDVTGNPELTKLYVEATGLVALDLRQNPKLTQLDVNNNSTVILKGSTVSVLPNFDPARAYNITGGNFDGNRINFTSEVGRISYTYDCGPELPHPTFTLHQRWQGPNHDYPGWIVWTEGFEGEELPAGWYQDNKDRLTFRWGTKYNWEGYSRASHHGFGCAYVSVDTGCNDWLYTPAFTVEEGYNLSFSFFENTGSPCGTKMDVYVVPENKDPIRLSRHTATNEWKTLNASLSNYVGQTVRVAFVCPGSELGYGNLTLDCVTLWTDRLAINEAHFPDDVFRSHVGMLASWKDYFTYEEVPAVTSLNCKEMGIRDLTGIAYFTGLQELNCSGNQLTALDVSKLTKLRDLNCGSNQLTSLQVDNLVQIENLDCSYNQLTALDVSKLTKLKNLYCDNNQLAGLDLTNNPELTGLNFSYNCLTHVDLENHPHLIDPQGFANEAEVDNLARMPETFNPSLVSDVQNGRFNGSQVIYDAGAMSMTYTYRCGPEVSFEFTLKLPPIPVDAEHFPDPQFRAYVQQYQQNGALDRGWLNRQDVLNISNNRISNLTGIGYFPNLKKLDCSGNLLTGLDLSKNPRLTELNCSENPLTQLDLGKVPGLQKLDCWDTQLTGLNLSKNPRLTELDCSCSPITQLDVSRCPALAHLVCTDTLLRELDLSKNTALENLDCQRNQLTQLLLPDHSSLTYLSCGNNQLMTLDVSGCEKLQFLYTGRNQLRALTLPKNSALVELDYKYNQLVCLDISYTVKLYDDGNQRAVRENTALTDLDPSFDLNKVNKGSISGGNFADGRVHFDPGSEEISYNYALKGRFSQSFTMKKQSGTYMELSDDGKTLLVGSEQDATLIVAAYDSFGRMQNIQRYTIPAGTLDRDVPFGQGRKAFLLDGSSAPLYPKVG